jgi:hypothetical protein
VVADTVWRALGRAGRRRALPVKATVIAYPTVRPNYTPRTTNDDHDDNTSIPSLTQRTSGFQADPRLGLVGLLAYSGAEHFIAVPT